MTSELTSGCTLSRRLAGPESSVVGAAWSPSGRMLAAGAEDGSVWIWDLEGCQGEKLVEGFPAPPCMLAWSSDETLLVAGTRSGTVARCDLQSGTVVPVATEAASLVALSWLQDMYELAAAGRESEFPADRFCLHRINPRDGAVSAFGGSPIGWNGVAPTASPDGRFVALLYLNRVVELWDLSIGQSLGTLPAGARQLRGVAVSGDQTRCVIHAFGGEFQWWSIPEKILLCRPRLSNGKISAITISRDGQFFAFRSEDGSLGFGATSDWRVTHLHKGAKPKRPGAFIAFHPSENIIAGFGEDESVLQLWRFSPGELRSEQKVEPSAILFIGADSCDSGMKLDEQFRAIQDHLALAGIRERFDLHVRLAAKQDDLIKLVTNIKPRIVHFAGNGLGGGVVLQAETGQYCEAGVDALASFFSLVSDYVECVVFNIGGSELQARAISKHIAHAIGMRSPISDKAATAYCKGFYQALGSGASIEKAHEFGRVQVLLYGLTTEGEAPLLLCRPTPLESAVPAGEDLRDLRK